MKLRFKNALIVCSAIAIIFVFNLSVQAYVLQGRHVLDLMIEKLGTANSLFVSQKLIFYRIDPSADRLYSAASDDSDLAAEPADNVIDTARDIVNDENAAIQETLELEESLRYVFSQAFRSDARSLETERIHIFSGNEVLTVIDGHIVPGAENRFNRYKDILLYRSREKLADRLLELGVDVFISSLGRFEEKIAFVIGAEYPDESVSQVWIDQETFLPLRWIIKSSVGVADSSALEIRYGPWWKIGKTRYPSRIEFHQDGQLVRVSQVIKVEEDAIFSDALFDIERLKLSYPQASTQPALPDESEEPSEVQQTIEEFKRIFE